MTVGETPAAEAWREGRGGEQAEGVWQTGRPGDPGARYSAYMEAPVDWIGEIPAHWDVVALKRVAPFVSRGSAPEYAEDETGTPVINQACVYWDGLRLDRVKYDQSPRPAKTRKGYLQKGDVLVNSTGTGTLGRAAVFKATGEHIADTHVTIVRLDRAQCEPRYLAYLLATPIYQGFIYTALVSGSTNQIELSREDLRAAPTILPPLDEQSAIAAFLDRETAKIDALIEKKQQMTKLLSERVQSIIDRQCFGLSNDALEPNSSRYWFPELPACWTICAIKNLADYGYRTFTDGDWVETPYIRSDGVRLIQTGNIGIGRYREQGYRYISEESFEDLDCTEVVPGDILICRLAEPVGRACVAPNLGKKMITSVDVCIIKPRSEVNSQYVSYLLSTSYYLNWMDAIARGGTRGRVSRTMLGEIRAPLPPREVQDQIVSNLTAEIKHIDDLDKKLGDQIRQLREYRTALISATVTGQIDVRGRV